MLKRLIALCLCLFALPWGAPVAAAEAPATYRLAYGDVLHLNVLEQPNLINPGSTMESIYVRPDGKINLPLIGEVQAAGLTVSDLAALLTRAYSKYFKTPHVAASLIAFRPVAGTVRVSVIGQVTRTGVLSFDKPPTVFEAVSAAGGYTDKADRGTVTIYSKSLGGKVTTINLDQLVKSGQQEQMVLGDGDTVEVGRTGGIDWAIVAPIALGVATLIISIISLTR